MQGDHAGTGVTTEDDNRITMPATGRISRWIVTIVGIAALTTLVAVERGTLGESVSMFGDIRWRWIPFAVAVEGVSMSAFARAQRRFLVVAGHDVPVLSAVRTAYAGNAITGTVPMAGSQLGTLFTFRAYRGHGADAPSVAWALAMAGVLSSLAFGLVAGVGAVVSGNPFAAGAAVGSAVAMFLGTAFAVWALRRESWRPHLHRRAVVWVGRWQRVSKRSYGEPHELVTEAFDRFDVLRPTRGDYGKVFALTVVNCVADAACLLLCILAIGADVPWSGLILVWVAGSTAKGVLLTPGGVGFVEAAIAASLVAVGVSAAPATAAALLYRFISFWLLIIIGWLVFASRRSSRGRRRISTPGS